MSNSDDKLDVVYKQLNATADNARSPVDLDDKLRAAAQASVTQATPTSRNGWQQRYGWATAASVVLASALFLALPDNTPPQLALPSERSASPAQAKPQPPQPIVAADQTVQADQPDQIEAVKTQGQRARQPAIPAAVPSEFVASSTTVPDVPLPLPMPMPLPTPAVPAASKTFAPYARTAAPSKSANASITSNTSVTSNTSNIANRSQCEHYGDLLITRVCRESEESFTLYAAETSPCATLSYLVETKAGAPTPHSSSDRNHFVIDSKDGPDHQLVCERGALSLQSLARGR